MCLFVCLFVFSSFPSNEQEYFVTDPPVFTHSDTQLVNWLALCVQPDLYQHPKLGPGHIASVTAASKKCTKLYLESEKKDKNIIKYSNSFLSIHFHYTWEILHSHYPLNYNFQFINQGILLSSTWNKKMRHHNKPVVRDSFFFLWTTQVNKHTNSHSLTRILKSDYCPKVAPKSTTCSSIKKLKFRFSLI